MVAKSTNTLTLILAQQNKRLKGIIASKHLNVSPARLASDELPEELITSTLTPGQQAQSANLFASLRTAFGAYALIRARAVRHSLKEVNCEENNATNAHANSLVRSGH